MASELRPPVCDAMRRFRRGLEERFGDRLVDLRVFGSQARGIVHEDSDVDVLVLIRDIAFPEDRAVTDLAFDVEREMGFSLAISPLVRTPEAWADLVASERLIALDVEREGVPV